MNLRALARSLFMPVALVVVYRLLRAIFDSWSDHGGLISPSGSVSLPPAILGVCVIVLRNVAFFIAPGWIAYAVIAMAVDRLTVAPPSFWRKRT